MELLTVMTKFSILLFVVSTMLLTGMELRLTQITDVLKRPLFVADVLATNFLLMPLATLGLLAFLPVSDGTRIGLIILSLSAGAPFIPKLAKIAGADGALATAAMLLLMVATVFVLPLGLPIMLDTVRVDSAGIAKSLVEMMIVPLGIGLALRAHNERLAAKWQGAMARLSDFAMLLMVLLLSLSNFKNVLGFFGTGFLAVLLFMMMALLLGYVAGGSFYRKRVVSALAAGQRGVSAALIVEMHSFDNPDAKITIVTVMIVGLFILIFAAKKFAR